MADTKYTRWLDRELPQWIEQGLVNSEQADRLSRYYQDLPGRNTRSIFSVIGAILFGLGIILFFAYNWADMHRYIKLLVIFGTMVATHAGALWFDATPRRQHAASEGLAMLGTLLFGGAIFLISQIYHIDEHYPNAFWLWGLAALAMAWVRQSESQCLAAIVLLFTWGAMETFSFHMPFHSSPWWLLLGTASLAWRLQSARLLFLSVCAFYLLWMFSLFGEVEETTGYVLFAVSVVLVQLGFLSERLGKNPQWPARTALAVPGFLAYMGIVFALTFAHFIDGHQQLHLFDTATQSRFFWGSLVVSMALPLLSLLPLPGIRPLPETDLIHTLLMLVTVILAFLIGPGWLDLSYGVLSGIMNLVFIGHCFLFIWHGSQRQCGWEVTAGCLLFAHLVFARYSDLFDSLLSRSLVFLVLGASLFVVGNFYSRHRKTGSSMTSAQGGNDQ